MLPTGIAVVQNRGMDDFERLTVMGAIVGGAPADLVAWLQTPREERGPYKPEWWDWVLEPEEQTDARWHAAGKALGERMRRRLDAIVLKVITEVP